MFWRINPLEEYPEILIKIEKPELLFTKENRAVNFGSLSREQKSRENNKINIRYLVLLGIKNLLKQLFTTVKIKI